MVVRKANVRADQTELRAPKDEQLQMNRTGLVNFGNTCYVNNLMQCLLRCELLMEVIKLPIWERQKDVKTQDLCFKKTLQGFFDHFSETERIEAYAPTELFAEICRWNQCLHYKLGGQQDSAELLSVLLQKLTEQNIIAGNLYTGELETRTCCGACHTVTGR